MTRTSKLHFAASFGEGEATHTEPASVCIKDPRGRSLKHVEEKLGIGEDLKTFDLGGLECSTRDRDAQILYRQLLLEDVIHRTSNTLQVAISALDAQISVANDAWTARDLGGLRKQLLALSGAHRQLYRPIDHLDSSLKTCLLEICSSVFESFGRRSARVSLAVQVAEVLLQRHQEIGLRVMLNELVTNALKHGFPGESEGTIWVEFDVDAAATCHLIVSDNGAGRPRLRQNATGLSLVHDFASLLEGQFEISWGARKVAKVSFPLASN
jgi:two-component sensor histidine kinase